MHLADLVLLFEIFRQTKMEIAVGSGSDCPQLVAAIPRLRLCNVTVLMKSFRMITFLTSISGRIQTPSEWLTTLRRIVELVQTTINPSLKTKYRHQQIRRQAMSLTNDLENATVRTTRLFCSKLSGGWCPRQLRDTSRRYLLSSCSKWPLVDPLTFEPDLNKLTWLGIWVRPFGTGQDSQDTTGQVEVVCDMRSAAALRGSLSLVGTATPIWWEAWTHQVTGMETVVPQVKERLSAMNVIHRHLVALADIAMNYSRRDSER